MNAIDFFLQNQKKRTQVFFALGGESHTGRRQLRREILILPSLLSLSKEEVVVFFRSKQPSTWGGGRVKFLSGNSAYFFRLSPYFQATQKNVAPFIRPRNFCPQPDRRAEADFSGFEGERTSSNAFPPFETLLTFTCPKILNIHM